MQASISAQLNLPTPDFDYTLRLTGTLLRALHELPGATFSNPAQRDNYDSEAKAVMTLGELERWLTEDIVSIYHAKRHRGSVLHRCNAGPPGYSATSRAAALV